MGFETEGRSAFFVVVVVVVHVHVCVRVFQKVFFFFVHFLKRALRLIARPDGIKLIYNLLTTICFDFLAIFPHLFLKLVLNFESLLLFSFVVVVASLVLGYTKSHSSR